MLYILQALSKKFWVGIVIPHLNNEEAESQNY